MKLTTHLRQGKACPMSSALSLEHHYLKYHLIFLKFSYMVSIPKSRKPVGEIGKPFGGGLSI